MMLSMSKHFAAVFIAISLLAAPAGAMFNGNESQVFKNIAASTATFTLRGGIYAVTVHAGTWNAGSVTLQRQAADGSTMVTCLTAFSADGYATVNLPGGTYQFTIASASGVYADLTSVETIQ